MLLECLGTQDVQQAALGDVGCGLTAVSHQGGDGQDQHGNHDQRPPTQAVLQYTHGKYRAHIQGRQNNHDRQPRQSYSTHTGKQGGHIQGRQNNNKMVKVNGLGCGTLQGNFIIV